MTLEASETSTLQFENFKPYEQTDQVKRRNYKDIIAIVATAIIASLFIAGAIYLISYTARSVHTPMQPGDMKTIALGIFSSAGMGLMASLPGGLSILMIRSYRKNVPLLSD